HPHARTRARRGSGEPRQSGPGTSSVKSSGQCLRSHGRPGAPEDRRSRHTSAAPAALRPASARGRKLRGIERDRLRPRHSLGHPRPPVRAVFYHQTQRLQAWHRLGSVARLCRRAAGRRGTLCRKRARRRGHVHLDDSRRPLCARRTAPQWESRAKLHGMTTLGAMASILIIEDDPKQLKLYAKALRGYRLTCVTTGEAALKSLAETKPDL